MSVSPRVQAFRQRFRDANASDERDASAGTPEQRFAACLALHGLALWMDIERVVRDLGIGSTPEAVLAEVNRRRLADAPMPRPLRDRWRR